MPLSSSQDWTKKSMPTFPWIQSYKPSSKMQEHDKTVQGSIFQYLRYFSPSFQNRNFAYGHPFFPTDRNFRWETCP